MAEKFSFLPNSQVVYTFLCRLRSIVSHRDHFVQRLQGCKLPLAHSPMRPNVACGLPEIKNWSPTCQLESRGESLKR